MIHEVAREMLEAVARLAASEMFKECEIVLSFHFYSVLRSIHCTHSVKWDLEPLRMSPMHRNDVSSLIYFIDRIKCDTFRRTRQLHAFTVFSLSLQTQASVMLLFNIQ